MCYNDIYTYKHNSRINPGNRYKDIIIFTDNIDEVGTSGILLNQISDHQMMFTLVENCSYVIDVPTFIDIECNDHRSMQAFIRELEDNNIHDKLEQAIDSDPQEIFGQILRIHYFMKIVMFWKI